MRYIVRMTRYGLPVQYLTVAFVNKQATFAPGADRKRAHTFLSAARAQEIIDLLTEDFKEGWTFSVEKRAE